MVEEPVADEPGAEDVEVVMSAAKAWVALLGSIATALLGVYAADTTIGQICTIISVIATAFCTWFVENTPKTVA